MLPLAVMCDKVEIYPLALMSPATCKAFVGVAIPIPIFPVSPSTTNLPLPTLKSSPASVPRVTPIEVPASELMVSSAIFPTFVMFPSLKDVAVVEAIIRVPSSVIVLSVITVPPIVKSVEASIVVPAIVVAELAPIVAPSTVPPFISAVVKTAAAAVIVPLELMFPLAVMLFKFKEAAPELPILKCPPLIPASANLLPFISYRVAVI